MLILLHCLFFLLGKLRGMSFLPSRQVLGPYKPGFLEPWSLAPACPAVSTSVLIFDRLTMLPVSSTHHVSATPPASPDLSEDRHPVDLSSRPAPRVPSIVVQWGRDANNNPIGHHIRTSDPRLFRPISPAPSCWPPESNHPSPAVSDFTPRGGPTPRPSRGTPSQPDSPSHYPAASQAPPVMENDFYIGPPPSPGMYIDFNSLSSTYTCNRVYVLPGHVCRPCCVDTESVVPVCHDFAYHVYRLYTCVGLTCSASTVFVDISHVLGCVYSSVWPLVFITC